MDNSRWTATDGQLHMDKKIYPSSSQKIASILIKIKIAKLYFNVLRETFICLVVHLLPSMWRRPSSWRSFPLSIFLFFLTFLSSCQSNPNDNYAEEAKPIIHELVIELRSIKSRDDLIDAEGKLKPHFNKLADIMLRARKTSALQAGIEEVSRDEHSENETQEEESRESFLSHELRLEMNRILYMEGGREVIEKAQEEALYRLSNENNLKL